MADNDKPGEPPPAPPGPTRGLPRGADERLPNWNVWGKLKEVKLYEAVALSLNIDPRRLRRDEDAWEEVGDICFNESREFNERLWAAERLLSRSELLRTDDLDPPRQCNVSLVDFAAVADLMQWELRPEFPRLPKEGVLAQWADDPRWPQELDIAVTAWRAACNNAERDGMRPGEYMRKWLAEYYPSLSKAAVARIATVANWDKSPGDR